MNLDTRIAPRLLPRSGVARAAGLLIIALTAAVAVLLAAPGSTSDQVSDYGVRTVHPLMLLPLMVITGAAGLAAVCFRAAARAAAVVTALSGLQVAGIAVVAARDWFNFAGAGHASFVRGGAGSRLATLMLVVALAMIVAGLVLYRCGAERRHELETNHRSVLTGVLVAVGLPVLLCLVLSHPGVTPAGQFALWWSLPWGLGLVAAGTLQAPADRRAAACTVAVSVALTFACAAVFPLYGFGIRLPD